MVTSGISGVSREQLIEILKSYYEQAGKSKFFDDRLKRDEPEVHEMIFDFLNDVEKGVINIPEGERASFQELLPEDFSISSGVGPSETFIEGFNKTLEFLGFGDGFSRAEATEYLEGIYPEDWKERTDLILEDLVGPDTMTYEEWEAAQSGDRPTIEERRRGIIDEPESEKNVLTEAYEREKAYLEDPPGGGGPFGTGPTEEVADEETSVESPDDEIPDVLGPGGLDSFANDVAEWESERPEYKGHQASGAPSRRESFKPSGVTEPQYQLKAPEGAQLMYIEETGEYFLAIEGDIDDTEKDIIFVYEIPDEYNLSDITTWEGPQDITDKAFEGIAKPDEQMEAEVRNSLSPIIISTRDAFDAGFYNDDRLVTVAASISQIDELIAGDAEDIAAGFFNARKNMNSQDLHYHRLLQNDQYVAEVVAIQMMYGGTDEMDFATAEGIFRDNSTRYNDIIQEEFGDDAHREAAIMASEKLKKVNRSRYDSELSDKKANIIELAKQNGVDIPNIAVDYIADMWRKGLWSDNEVATQFSAVTDSYFEGKLDDGLKKALAGADYEKITRGEDEIQTLLDTYLPSSMHADFDMKTEAGKYRNITGYRQTLVGKLKELRKSEYDMYDEDIAWSTIVSGKRRLAENILGVQLNEGSAEQEIDPVLDHIIRLNDNGEAQGYLRNVGLERGYAKTEGELMKSMMASFGGGVVQSQSYGEA